MCAAKLTANVRPDLDGEHIPSHSIVPVIKYSENRNGRDKPFPVSKLRLGV